MKETSRSLLFSFPARECTQTLCDALDYFHTLHRLQRMIKIKIKIKNKKKWIFTTKSYNPKIWSSHITLRYIYIYKGFLQKQKSYASYETYNPSRKSKNQSK